MPPPSHLTPELPVFMAHMLNIMIPLLPQVKPSFLQLGLRIGPSPRALRMSLQFALVVAVVECTITAVTQASPMQCKAAVAAA
jgi:hypothetical protein